MSVRTVEAPVAAFSNEAGTVAPHPDGYVILLFAPGTWSVAALAALLTATGALLLAHGYHGLLADVRQLPVFSTEALTWLQSHWFARIVPQPAIIYKALLLPAQTNPSRAIALLREYTPAFTHYTYFLDEAAAHTYLHTLAKG